MNYVFGFWTQVVPLSSFQGRSLCPCADPNHHVIQYNLLILVGARSATALLQHGTPFLFPLKTVRPYIVSSAT